MEHRTRQDEKKVFILCSLLLLLVSCKSTDIPDPGSTAADVRDNLSEIQSQQSEINGTAERLAERLNAAAGTAAAGAELNEEFERIIEEIRKQRVGP